MKHSNLVETDVDVDCEEVSTLLAQEARANGIRLEGLPRAVVNDLRIETGIDKTLVEHPEGDSIKDKSKKRSWREACGKDNKHTHTSHCEAEENRRERQKNCHDHHLHQNT